MSDHKQTDLVIQALRNALKDVANYSDCLHDESGHGTGPKDCQCPVHVARRALATEKAIDWRFVSYMDYRRDTNPRERDIVAAWKAYISKPYSAGMDGTMSQIIGDEPSVRDWYVATSIIQWLATNCGMSVLEAAGFKYDWEKRRG